MYSCHYNYLVFCILQLRCILTLLVLYCFNYLNKVQELLSDLTNITVCTKAGFVPTTELHQGETTTALVHQQLEDLSCQFREVALTTQNHILHTILNINLNRGDTRLTDIGGALFLTCIHLDSSITTIVLQLKLPNSCNLQGIKDGRKFVAL